MASSNGSEIQSGLFSQRAFDALFKIFSSEEFVLWGFKRAYNGEIVFIKFSGVKPNKGTMHTMATLISRWIFRMLGKKPNKQTKISWNSTMLIGPSPERKVEVRELMFLIDWLNSLKIKTIIKRYGEDLVREMIGSPRDPFTVEKLKLKDEELSKLKSHYDDLIHDKMDQYNRLMEKVHTAYLNSVEKLKIEKQEAIDKLIVEYNSLAV